MGYEFNPQSQRFDVPNPHRVENLFLAVGAVLLIASGFASLFIARARITDPTQTAGRPSRPQWSPCSPASPW